MKTVREVVEDIERVNKAFEILDGIEKIFDTE
jgi:hypothetical protein